MADLVEPKLKPNSDLPHITIDASGTEYKVSVFLFNSNGEIKFIDANSFNSAVFQTIHTTPFLLGTLSLNDELNMVSLNKVDTGFDSLAFSEYNTTSDGQEFLRIKISSKSSTNVACQYTDEVLLDKIFVVKNKNNSVINNNKLVNYNFVDVIYANLANKKKEWSTDLLNVVKQQGAQPRRGQSPVNSGRALKHIIRHFIGDDAIIDEDNWDDGQGSVYLTLPAGAPAFTAIAEIMKTYVSTDESGGILTYYNGAFQLQSIRKLINKIYKNTNSPPNPWRHLAGASQVILGDNFGGGIKIKTNDSRQTYSNKEGVDTLGKDFNYIPVDTTNITFIETQPDATMTSLNKKEVTQFNSKTKQITIHSNQGNLSAVTKASSVEGLPGGKEQQLNIDENTAYSTEKTRIFKMTDRNSTMHYGTIKLQKQLLESLTKATFAVPGNIDMSANKFLYMTADLNEKNKFAHKIPGFWYITKNITTLSKGTFASSIECVKLDKPK